MIRIIAAILLFGLLANLVVAQPSQRLIITFEQALTAESAARVQQQLAEILDQPIQLGTSSHNQRWIVVLTNRLSSDQLHLRLKKINSLPNVSSAEVDSLMRAN